MVTKKMKSLSIVIPCFNEEAVIEETHNRLNYVLNVLRVNLKLEFVYVDDGSKDNTLNLLKKIQEQSSDTKIISLSRNFGHQIAVTAGVEHTSGDAVVIIDADLQDPPEEILTMVERWKQGVHVVYGQRTKRDGESFFKRVTAKYFYRVINRLSDVEIPIDTGDFRLMDRKAVDALLAMPEKDRFVRGMVAWLGFKQEAISYHRAARFAGETKYPLNKMFTFALDGILSFSIAPLRLAIIVGLTVIGFSIAAMVYAIVMRLMTNIWVPGWTLLFIGMLFMGSVQLIFLGVIGEYLGRIYNEVKDRPLYLIGDAIGFSIKPSNIEGYDKKRHI